MSTEAPFHNTQISAYNPGRLSDQEIERVFIARVKTFEYLFEQIIAEKTNSIPQHLLIIGERGMGKSLLLHRLAVELRKAPHNATWIPLTFPEEQYNIDRLSKFWLNCLDALADALDRIGHVETDALDADIDRWSKMAREIDAMQMYGHFSAWCHRLQHRPVLLVDNLSLIFDKISKEEQHQLRAILMENNAPILIGASAHNMEDVIDYGKPFYDYFKSYTLKKLTFEESLETLKNLGELSNNRFFIQELYAKKPRMQALYQLTGGTPRTLTMLYPLIQNGLSVSIQTDLEALMDTATSLYKARFEELPDQMQVVLDAVAMNWNPTTIETLRELTQLENAQISSQLTRLYNTGWLNRMDAYQTKGNAYEINERFFNIWYLMRRSTRRQKRELLCLSKFLSTFYGEELPTAAKDMLKTGVQHADHASIHLAMADALPVQNKRLSKKLRDNSYKALVEFGLKNGAVFRDFEVPKEFINKKEEALYADAIKKFQQENYKKAAEQLESLIKLNHTNKNAWYFLGLLFHIHLYRYTEAEESYRKAIELDEKFADAWNELGDLYQDHMYRYREAETAYKKAIELNEKYANPWCGLGTLYQDHLNQFTDAEQAYKKAIKLNKKYANPWNGLGNLYQDDLKRYEEAEVAYLTALSLTSIKVIVKQNLIFLYRDKMNRLPEAKALFEELKPNDDSAYTYYLNTSLSDTYYLNASLFAFYEKNIGIATAYLQEALTHTEGRLSPYTQDDWWRFAGVAHRLGYSEIVLETLETNGFDVQLRPYFVAIKALGEKDSLAYLNSIAAEVREPAAVILEKIRRF